MAQNLQGRMQLLGILIAVFILLSLPLFAQVRADAADSAARGDDTILGRFVRNIVKDIKGDTNDLEVEDAYNNWKEQNPDCTGAQCGPDGDLDGDGMSNKEELEKGRNPECNENELGYDHCKGLNTTTPTSTSGQSSSPTPTYVSPLNDLIFNVQDQDLSVTSPQYQTTPKSVEKKVPDYDKWRVKWSIDSYTGEGRFRITITNGTGATMSSEPFQLPSIGAGSSNPGQEYDVTINTMRKSSDNFTFQIRLEGSASLDGTWDITVRGMREARQVSS